MAVDSAILTVGDTKGHKGHSPRVPFNRIPPAQREGKQRWLREGRFGAEPLEGEMFLQEGLR